MSKGWWKSLYLQVLVAILAGVLLGYFAPQTGASLKHWARPSSPWSR